MLLEKNTYRYIEKILYKQNDLEYAINDARAEQLANKGNKSGGGGRSFISDQTAMKAIKMATPLKSVYVQGLGDVDRPEELRNILEKAYANEREWHRQLLRKRYRMGKSIQSLSIDYDRSEKTVYNICSAFVVDVGMRLASKDFIDYG